MALTHSEATLISGGFTMEKAGSEGHEESDLVAAINRYLLPGCIQRKEYGGDSSKRVS